MKPRGLHPCPGDGGILALGGLPDVHGRKEQIAYLHLLMSGQHLCNVEPDRKMPTAAILMQ